MLVFAREVFVSLCPTDVPPSDPNATGMASEVRWIRGTEADLARVDPEHHNEDHVADLKRRLDEGEYWLIGEHDGKIVSYTWLHKRDSASYPSLPGCEIRLRDDVGYGYDAWTPPELRGQGIRRVGFLAELNILRREWGLAWEASFFVKHQLEGATRSLGKAGIEVIPTYRVFLKRDRTLGAELLNEELADVAVPAFL